MGSGIETYVSLVDGAGRFKWGRMVDVEVPDKLSAGARSGTVGALLQFIHTCLSLSRFLNLSCLFQASAAQCPVRYRWELPLLGGSWSPRHS